MTKKKSYTEAFDELQELVNEIEVGEISVDDLSEKVRRAAELIKICKAKLIATELDVNQILEELSKEDQNDGEAERA
jgi:exodeoxyribonuclease VII small subunit